MGRGPQQPTGEDAIVQEKLRSAGEIPEHIAVIMDGNGRWAQQRGFPRIAGHQEGVESVRDSVEACGQLGVKYLTLYAFSTENWNRPQEEVSLLMRLLLKAIRDETDRLHRNNVRMQAIGDVDRLPPEVRNELFEGIQKTKNNSGLTLILALSYSGRWDLAQAVKRIVHDAGNGTLNAQAVDENLISSYLSTSGIPDPDLLIRTSGEFRISNFLLWQLAYSEMVITEKYWPSFRRNDLYEAIREYQCRERRFGMVSEQVERKPNGKNFFNRLFGSVAGSKK